MMDPMHLSSVHSVFCKIKCTNKSALNQESCLEFLNSSDTGFLFLGRPHTSKKPEKSDDGTEIIRRGSQILPQLYAASLTDRPQPKVINNNENNNNNKASAVASYRLCDYS